MTDRAVRKMVAQRGRVRNNGSVESDNSLGGKVWADAEGDGNSESRLNIIFIQRGYATRDLKKLFSD